MFSKKVLFAALGAMLLKSGLSAAAPAAATGTGPADAPATSDSSSQNSDGAVQLQQVTVTAERRSTPLQQTPIAVTAVSAKTLQNLQINNTAGLSLVAPELRFLPNVTTPDNFTPSLRGSNQQDAALVTAESPVGIYIDGVFVARMNANNLALSDIDQIEVLRGPQGTLFGRNTLTGAVVFDTRTPSETNQWLNASVSAGNFEQTRDTFSAGFPIGTTGWSASVSGLYSYKNGEWYNLGTHGDWGMERNEAERMKVHYQGIENLDFVAFVSYAKSNNDALPLVPATTPADPTDQYRFTSNNLVPQYGWYTLNVAPHNYGVPYVGDMPFGDTRQMISGATFAWHASDYLTLKSITGWVRTMDAYTTAYAGADPETTDAGISGSLDDSNEVTEELQALGKAFDARLNYVGGAYYFHEGAEQHLGFYGFGLGPLSYSNISANTNSYALYGQTDYMLTDALKLTAGIRWTEDQKDAGLAINQLGIIPAIFGTGFTTPESFKVPFVAITPKVGLDYTLPTFGPFNSMLTYLSAERGFMSGGFSGLNIFNLDAATQPYAPESNWTYEAGLKTDLLDHRVRVNAAYYIENITNLVLDETEIVAPGLSVFPERNAGAAQVKGLELEMSAVVTKGLDVFFNPTINSSRFTYLAPGAGPYLSRLANSDPASGGNGFSVSDPLPPLLPWFSFTTGLDYTRSIPGLGPDGAFIMGVNWYKTAQYVDSATEDFVVSGYDRLNGYVGMRFGSSWELRLSGSNLQNRTTVINGSRSLGGFYVLPPREALLQLSYNR